MQASAFAFEIEDSIHHKSRNLFGVLESFAVSCTSFANQSPTDWPLQTIPSFEGLVSSYREVSGTKLISMSPLVADHEKEFWENYSVAHQGWLLESYATAGYPAEPLEIRDVIYDIQDGHVVEAQDGPFVPLWQLSLPPKNTAVVNFNLMSNPVFSSTFDIAQTYSEALFSKTVSASEVLGVEEEKIEDLAASSECLLIQPIFDEITTSTTKKVVGTVLAVLSWQDFMSNLVRDGNQGMMVVIENSCEQEEETYQINGSETLYLGKGDHHDPHYDDYRYETKIVPFSTIPEDTDGFCEYFAEIYPTKGVEESNKTHSPALFTTLMVLLFVAAAVGFLLYDIMVQRRQREAMTSAARSNAIVSSLFPAEIRDRLFNGDVDIEQEMKNKEGSKMGRSRNPNVPEAQNARLKNYLNDEGNGNQDGGKGIKPLSPTDIETKPIADLFPNTTVLFADIAGFTAWSSVREPSQVFTLLETVYKAFDKTAKRRRVFKVETVGDCYVAVTGLPEPIKNHAEVMCRFSRECLAQFRELVTQLEVILG